MILTQ